MTSDVARAVAARFRTRVYCAFPLQLKKEESVYVSPKNAVQKHASEIGGF